MEERSQNFFRRFEMANTVRTGRFFHAGTGGNLDLLPQDAILPERCTRVHPEQVLCATKADGSGWVAWSARKSLRHPGFSFFRATYEAD
jgi:hypothetical protein